MAKKNNNKLTLRFTKEKYIPNNIFGVDLRTEEGVKEYNRKYQRFYYEVYKQEKELRRINRMNGIKEPVKLAKKELAKILKNIMLCAFVFTPIYLSTFYSMMCMVFNSL